MAKKILVVDDDLPVLTLMVDRLKNSGYEVIAASEAYQAVRLALSEKPALIVLDIRMPAGGLNAYENIRHSIDLALTPIIFSSAYVDEKVLKIVDNDPAADYVAKPFKMEVLLGKIKIRLGE
jgi:two-component system alkaline phosphatase synthesis response regulator PhoP